MSRLVADGERLIEFGELPDRQRAAVGQDVEGRELGEPEAQLPELAGEADHELPPQRAAHRHALADLANVPDPAPGRQDRGREVLLEAARDRARGRGAVDRAGWALVGHGPRSVRCPAERLQRCT